MRERLRRVGIYFGVRDMTPEGEAAQPPPRPLAAWLLATTIAVVIVGTAYGLIVQDVSQGLRAAAVGLVVATGVRIWERLSSD